MGNWADMDREWTELMASVRDESLTQEQHARLEDRLRNSKEDREQYLRHSQLHSLLELFPPRMDEGVAELSVRNGNVRRFPGTIVSASLAVAASLILTGFVFFAIGAFSDSGRSQSVATLLLAEDCHWGPDGGGILEGQILEAGVMWLREGSAVIRFTGGAEMILQGDTRLNLLSSKSVRILHGEAVVRAEDGAEGFTVITPEGEMVDLGTEFAVRVDEKGGTELHVHEGEVSAAESVFAAGSAVRFEHQGKSRRQSDVEPNAPRFKEVLDRSNARERRDLMWAYEGFYVDEGEYRTEEMNGGKGWSGSWRLREKSEGGIHDPDTYEGMRITHGKMNMAWPVKGGRLGMLELPAGHNVRTRPLEHAVDLAKDGVTYFSFLAAETPVPGEGKGEKSRRDDLRLTFRSSEDYFGESLSFGWSKQRMPRVQIGGGGLQRALREIPENETVFCVAKIIHSRNGPDRVFFRFYRESDDLDVLEPADWDIKIEDADLNARLDLLLVTSTGDCSRFVDEIRMGPSWRSVTPLDHKETDLLSFNP